MTSLEEMHVLDLPQLHTKPSAETLIRVLQSVKRNPRSWNQNEVIKPDQDLKGLEKYLTSIIASPLKWIEDDEMKEKIWEEASSRLSERSGRSGMSAFTRSFDISTVSGTITIQIHEPALTSDNLGFKTWAASYVLAQRLSVFEPRDFVEDGQIQALELGSGTGLVGMAAAAIWSSQVLLTDLPEIAENLSRNVDSNANVINNSGGRAIAGILDWESPKNLQILPTQNQSKGSLPSKFPVILAADSIYSDNHPKLLACVIKEWLYLGSKSRVLIALPIRSGYGKELDIFRAEMKEAGFVLVSEDDETGYDDWGAKDDEGRVTCWISVWAWANIGAKLM